MDLSIRQHGRVLQNMIDGRFNGRFTNKDAFD